MNLNLLFLKDLVVPSDFLRVIACSVMLWSMNPDSILAQDLDSILQEQHFDLRDTLLVYRLFDIAYPLEYGQPDSALFIYSITEKLSKNIDYSLGEGKSLLYSGIVHTTQSNFDSANHYYQKALTPFQLANYRIGVAAVWSNIGNTSNYLGDYNSAIDYYLKAIDIYKGENDDDRLITLYSNLAGVFNGLRQYKEAVHYHNLALSLAMETKDTSEIVYSLMNLGISYINLDSLDQAAQFLHESAQKGRILNDPNWEYELSKAYYELHYNKGEHSKSREYAVMALKHAELLQSDFYIAAIQLKIARCDLILGNGGVMARLEEIYPSLISFDNKEMLSEYFLLQSQVYEGTKNYGLAMEKLKEYYSFRDSAQITNQANRILELERKYQLSEREKELASLQLTNLRQETRLKRNRMVLLVLAIVALLLGVLLYFFMQQSKIKQQLNQQALALEQKKTDELKSRNKILAMNSMIEGQEEERSRIAKDLHDGLGGLMATIRSHYQNIRQESEKVKELNSYRRTEHLIDEACEEVRRISHDMMPASLSLMGLNQAIEDLSNRLVQTGLNCEVEISGEKADLGIQKETMLYRIIQELCHNVQKHANAQNLLIQILYSAERINVLVEDDGIGFDTLTRQDSGLGLNSVRSRVEFLSGEIDVYSEPGKGASIAINIPLVSIDKTI